MNYQYGRGAAVAMLPAALMTRLFIGLAVDYPIALNAAWICPLVGLMICLPLFFALWQAQKLGNGSPWENASRAMPRPARVLAELVFALTLTYDAAANVRLTASSSNIIALGDTTVHLLIVPLGIVAGAIVLMGGDALGDSVRIFMRILPLFALIVLLVQLPGYRVGWLCPILGEGLGGIISGGIYCAGCMSLMCLIWLNALPDRNKGGFWRYILLPTGGAIILLLTQQMSFPVMPETEFTRAACIELILSNGRMSLYPQFVLNILWYGGLLILFSVETAASAAYLKRAFPGIKIWMLALAEACGITFAAIFNPSWLKNSAAYIRLLFPLLGGLLAITLAAYVISNKGKDICADSK